MHRLAYIFVGSIAFLAVLTVIVRLFLPSLNPYKDDVTARLSEMLGVDIQVDKLQLSLDGIQPELSLSQVEISTPEHPSEVLRVEKLRARIDLFDSLLDWQIKISDLYIFGADFLIVTDAAGNSHVSGLLPMDFLSSDTSAKAKVTEVTFHFEQLSVRWRNEQLGTDYSFAEVHGSFERRMQQLKASLDARLPTELGHRLYLSIDLRDSDAPNFFALNDADWSGQFHFGVDAADLEKWAYLLGEEDTVSGVLTTELRGDFEKAKLRQFTGSVECRSCEGVLDVVAQDAISAVSMQTNFLWETSADGWMFELAELNVEASGIEIRGGQVEIDYAEGGSQITLQMPSLDMRTMATAIRTSGWLDADAVKILDGWGDIKGSGFVAHRPLAELSTMATVSPQSGLDFLAGEIELSGNYIRAYLQQLRDPLELKTVTAQLALKETSLQVPSWSQRVFNLSGAGMEISYLAEPRQLRIGNLSLYLDGMHLSGEVVWTGGGSPTVNSTLSLANLALTSIGGLLPERGLPPQLRQWLDNAFVAGVMKVAHVELDGALSSFPFDKHEGKFYARGEFANATLNYHSEQKPLEDVDGYLVFDNEKLSIEATRGHYYDLDLHWLRVTLKNMMAPFVDVEASGEGPISNIFSYLGDIRLIDSNSAIMRNLELEGDGLLDLTVGIPLNKAVDQALTVEGALSFRGSSLQVVPMGVRFNDIEGILRFDSEGAKSELLKANLDGATITGRAETASGGTRLILEAELPIAQAFSWVDVPVQKLLRGRSPWRGELLIPKLDPGPEMQLQMSLSSPLEGVEVALPSPFGKSSNQKRDFSVRMTLGESGSQYEINYGIDVDARISRSTDKGSAWSGYLHFGQEDPPLFETGVFKIDGEITPEVDLGEWFDLMKGQGGGGSRYLSHVNLSFDELRKGDNVLGEASIIVESKEGGRRFKVDAPWVSGWGVWPDTADRNAFIQLDRLFLMKGKESTDTTTTLNPQAFPPIELQIADFKWGDARVSDLQFLAEPSDIGMKIGRLNFQSAGVSVSSHGSWLSHNGRHSTQLDFNALGENFGESLQLLHMSDKFKGGNGSVRGSMEWDTWFGGFSLARLEGEVGIKLVDGFIEKADPGVGRLLGLLSADHIVQRLSLDFSDVLEKGLTYDKISGNFKFHNGVMSTDDLSIIGSALSMSVRGDSDVVRKRYDQYIDVVPDLSSSLPVASALLGGPIAGAAVYVLDKFTDVGSRVNDALTLRYHLHGDWDAPQIDFQGTPVTSKGTQRVKDVLRKVIP